MTRYSQLLVEIWLVEIWLSLCEYTRFPKKMSLYFARLACPSICASMATVNCTHRIARNTAMRLYLRDALISRQAIVSLTLYLVNFRSSRGGGVNRANNTNSERSIVSKTIAIVPIYCYRHSNLLLPFVLFHR